MNIDRNEQSNPQPFAFQKQARAKNTLKIGSHREGAVFKTCTPTPKDSTPKIGAHRGSGLQHSFKISTHRDKTALPNQTQSKTSKIAQNLILHIDDYQPSPAHTPARPVTEKLTTQSKRSVITVNKGKCKELYGAKGKVLFVPIGEVGTKEYQKKEAEIRAELQVAKEINQKLTNCGREDLLQYVVTDMKIVEDISTLDVRNKDSENLQLKEISGKLIVETGQAKGSLDSHIREDIGLGSRFSLCEDVIGGVAGLHAAGVLHGDLKTENFLFFKTSDSQEVGQNNGDENNQNTKGVAKVADFGKAVKIAEVEAEAEAEAKTETLEENPKMLMGNSRFSGPEEILSAKAEVYSAALIMIRILEEELVRDKEGNETMVCSENTDPRFKPSEDRRGIERHLIMNQNTHQRENRDAVQNLKVRASSVLHYATTRLKKMARINESAHINQNETDAVHAYIDELFSQLEKVKDADPSQLSATKDLLFRMTAAIPKLRPTASDAKNQIKVINSAASARMAAAKVHSDSEPKHL